jgi:hypothetical protein
MPFIKIARSMMKSCPWIRPAAVASGMTAALRFSVQFVSLAGGATGGGAGAGFGGARAGRDFVGRSGGGAGFENFPAKRKNRRADGTDQNQHNHHRHQWEIVFGHNLPVFGNVRRGPFAGLGAGDDEFLVVSRGRLGHGDFLEARRAFHLRASLRRIALDVLAAHRTGVFELAHGSQENISYLRLFGNGLFYQSFQPAGRRKCLCVPASLR